MGAHIGLLQAGEESVRFAAGVRAPISRQGQFEPPVWTFRTVREVRSQEAGGRAHGRPQKIGGASCVPIPEGA